MGDFNTINLKDITVQNGIKSISERPLINKKENVDDDLSFADVLKRSINEVDDLQKNSDLAVAELALGNNKNVHETMISMEKADISFKLMMRVRNKILEAYKEVMRMNI